jgi:hypothetical protein
MHFRDRHGIIVAIYSANLAKTLDLIKLFRTLIFIFTNFLLTLVIYNL